MFITAATIALIIKAVAIIEGIVLFETLILNFTQIVDWFQERRANPELDNQQIYFTLQELWSTGNYNTVQGVFDTRTNRLGAIRRINSSGIDAQLANAHRNHRLANYE